MAGASTPIDTGGGSISPSSSAASDSGDIRSSGDKAYGGINIAPSSGGFNLPTKSIVIAVGLTALYFFAKKKKYI